MKNMTETISRYVGAWNELTAEAVKAALTASCAASVTYTDKNTPLFTGIEPLVELILGSHDQLPGRTFPLVTEPEYFEGQCYYTWGLDLPGKPRREGHDFVEYDSENKITRIVGFVPA